MKINSIIAFSAVALLSTLTRASNLYAEAKPDAAFEQKMEAYLASSKGKEAIGKTFESYIQERQANARKAAEEAQKAEMERQFKNPVKIEIGNSPVKGPQTAKITIVEFSDFQCPYCSRGRDTMEQVLKAYPDNVKLVFKNLPLPFHDKALPAAKAALAANKQGKFWEMHDEFFANQGKLSDDFFVATATKLGLNVEKFKTDMADPEIAKQVEEDKAIAEKNDIQGTPGFFVNGVAVKGAYPLEHFKGIIDKLLAAK